MLKFALDKAGGLINCNLAGHGVDYYCPCCGAIVRLKISKNGVPFFFCHHSKHTETNCAKLAEKVIDFDPNDIDVGKIMIGMMHIPATRGPGHPHGPGPKGPYKPATELTSMHQLWASGIPYGEPDMPVHNGILADYLIGPKSFKKYLVNCEELGTRIIMAMPEKVFSNNRIRFICPWMETENGRLVNDNMRLTIHFADPEIFTKRRDDIFAVAEHGEWIPRYQYVLIAADWHLVSRDECQGYCYKCRNGARCRGMLTAECHSAGQIYIPRTPRNCK